MPFELVERAVPLTPIWLEPVVERDQRFHPQPVDATLRLDASFDEAAVAQDAQVLRDRWLRDAEPPLELADRLLALDQFIEDRATVGFGQNVEYRLHGFLL